MWASVSEGGSGWHQDWIIVFDALDVMEVLDASGSASALSGEHAVNAGFLGVSRSHRRQPAIQQATTARAILHQVRK